MFFSTSLVRFGLTLAMASLVVSCSEPAPSTATKVEDFASRRDQMKTSLAKAGAGVGQVGGQAGRLKNKNSDSMNVLAGLSYGQGDRRDPFRSFQFDESEDFKAPLGPLADYELSQLSVVAVVWDTNNARALIADPGGRAFVLHAGSQVGKNRGRVMAISDSMVSVRETYVDFEGHQSTKDVEMRIRGNQEG